MNRSTVTPVRNDAQAKKIWTAPAMEVVLPDHAKAQLITGSADGQTYSVGNYMIQETS